MTANPYEIERRLIKEEVIQYFEQKDCNGNRMICKETKHTRWGSMDDPDEEMESTVVEYF